MSLLEADTWDRGQIVASGKHGHAPELEIAPPVHVQLADVTEPRAVDGDARPVLLQFEDDLLAAEDEQVRVLRNDAVDNALAFEIEELGIGLVWSDDVLDAFRTKSLLVSYVMGRCSSP